MLERHIQSLSWTRPYTDQIWRQTSSTCVHRLLREGSHAHLLDLPADFSGPLLRWAGFMPELILANNGIMSLAGQAADTQW